MFQPIGFLKEREMIFYIFELQWWHYILAGFLVGAYLHSKHIHHAVHWLIVIVLQGIVWLLIKTDPLYRIMDKPKAKEESDPNPVTKSPDGSFEVDEKELNKWLKGNKDLSVEKREQVLDK